MNYVNMWQEISNIKRNTITYSITILTYAKHRVLRFLNKTNVVTHIIALLVNMNTHFIFKMRDKL